MKTSDIHKRYMPFGSALVLNINQYEIQKTNNTRLRQRLF